MCMKNVNATMFMCSKISMNEGAVDSFNGIFDSIIPLKEENGYYVFEMEKGVVTISFECAAYTKACPDDENTLSICWGPYVLATISENKDYITVDKNSLAQLQHNGNLQFTLGDIIFKPLNIISDEYYHLYVKLQ